MLSQLKQIHNFFIKYALQCYPDANAHVFHEAYAVQIFWVILRKAETPDDDLPVDKT